MGDDTDVKSLNAIVQALKPLEPSDRKRVVLGALNFLGENWSPSSDREMQGKNQDKVAPEIGGDFPVHVKKWLKKVGLTEEEIEMVFSFDQDDINIIGDVPGHGKKDKTIAIYTLIGVGTYLLNGEKTFNDDMARRICDAHGAFDKANHAANMKATKKVLTGDKTKGWTITAPGLNSGATLIKSIASTD